MHAGLLSGGGRRRRLDLPEQVFGSRERRSIKLSGKPWSRCETRLAFSPRDKGEAHRHTAGIAGTQ